MKTMQVFFSSLKNLEEAFEEVISDWELCPSERDAVRGTSLAPSRTRRSSAFVAERMALVIEIDWLLGSRMESAEIRQWIRRRVAGVFGSSPLDDMFGSTDRLRRIRAMLALENSQ